MTFSHAFAIVQWGIVLPVQGYLVFRSWRNWKASDRELREASRIRETLLDMLVYFKVWAHEQGCDLDELAPPTLQ